jgi:hypothetical protein
VTNPIVLIFVGVKRAFNNDQSFTAYFWSFMCVVLCVGFVVVQIDIGEFSDDSLMIQEKILLAVIPVSMWITVVPVHAIALTLLTQTLCVYVLDESILSHLIPRDVALPRILLGNVHHD